MCNNIINELSGIFDYAAELEKDVEKLTSSNKELEGSLITVREKVDNLNSDLSEASTENCELRDELVHTEMQNSVLRDLLEDSETSLKLVNADFEKVSYERDTYSMELSVARANLEKISAEYSRLESILRNLRGVNAALKISAEEMLHKLATYEVKMEADAEKIEKLKSNLQAEEVLRESALNLLKIKMGEEK